MRCSVCICQIGLIKYLNHPVVLSIYRLRYFELSLIGNLRKTSKYPIGICTGLFWHETHFIDSIPIIESTYLLPLVFLYKFRTDLIIRKWISFALSRKTQLILKYTHQIRLVYNLPDCFKNSILQKTPWKKEKNVFLRHGVFR